MPGNDGGIKSEPKPLMEGMGGRGGGRGGPRGGGSPMTGGRPPMGGGRGGPGGNMGGGPPHQGGPRGGGHTPRGRGGPGGRGGNTGGPGRGGNFGGGGGPGGFRRDQVAMRLQELQGPCFDLPPIDMSEKQFSGRSRLYIGNLAPNTTEDELRELVTKFGSIGELFLNAEKNFAFTRLDYRENAEKAKRELDGKMFKNRNLKVRFAPHQGALRIKNLGPWVSNELLHRAFSVFGELERALVFVDDRGRSKGEGIVEFEKKPSAMDALRRCSDGAFFVTASLRPVIVELMDNSEDDDGLQEKMLPKRSPEFNSEREAGPRFAEPGSFEHEYGQKWKQLYEMKKQKIEAMEREMKLEEDKLVAQMEFARYEHETEALRQQLAKREQERERTKNMWEQREQEMSRMFEMEHNRRLEEEKSMMERMQRQDETMRKRQEENNMFIRGQDMNPMMDERRGGMMPGGSQPMGRPGGMMPGMGGQPGGGNFNGMGGGDDFGRGGGNDSMERMMPGGPGGMMARGGGRGGMVGTRRHMDSPGPVEAKRGRRF